MRVRGIDLIAVIVALGALAASGTTARGQEIVDHLLVVSDTASVWDQAGDNVVQLQGQVRIDLDGASLSADQAVLWISPRTDAIIPEQQLRVALLGNAQARQEMVHRSGPALFISATVRGEITLRPHQAMVLRDLSQSPLYREAQQLRAASQRDDPTGGQWLTAPRPASAAAAARRADRPASQSPVDIEAGRGRTVTTDGNVSLILWDGVTLIQRRPDGDFLELRARRAVIHTAARGGGNSDGSASPITRPDQAVNGAYLEGDVRIALTSARGGAGEQRLEAERVYYDFTTDRAVLTDAVIHAIDPQRQIPIVLRASVLRQLSLGEYSAEKIRLSTSSFATPSYALAADRAYVRQSPTTDPRYGSRTELSVSNVTFNLYGLPFFWLPVAGGSFTERGFPLRALSVTNSTDFGLGVRSEWGLFETLGQLPPENVDLSYSLDYLSDRGAAVGLDGDYQGGFVSDTTRQRWDYQGELTSYFVVSDHGIDHLGRANVTPFDEFRGRALWEHQYFFPQGWQVQARAGWLSDATFQEEWFRRQFETNLPVEDSLYLKRQRGTEAFTLLLDYPVRDFVSSSDLQQEQFEVQRLPEIGYYRVGDAVGPDDSLTFFSDNTYSRLRYRSSAASLADQGFNPAAGVTPGLASTGTTGTLDRDVSRVDFREEVDLPFSAGQFRVVPYVMGRYTGYSNSPDGNKKNRLLGMLGIRLTTALWKVDDSAQSRLLDIHRLRHVIEPEIHLFTSAATKDRTEVFIYDEPVDAINDVSAMQLALRQRWQTKRGGPGAWRSVDFFALNVEANFFSNRPDPAVLRPDNFRDLFFTSIPEASIPRNAINADAAWRISDTTVLLSDAAYNIDAAELATASVGLAVRRDPRMAYFLGLRYIEELNSTIAAAALNYELSRKYTLIMAQSWDFGDREAVGTTLGVTRRFDRLLASFRFTYDAVADTTSFNFTLIPEGLNYGVGSDTLDTFSRK